MDAAGEAVDRIGAAHVEADLALARSEELLKDLRGVEEERHPSPIT